MMHDYALVAVAIAAVWIAFRFLFPQGAMEHGGEIASEDVNSSAKLHPNDTKESL